MKNQLRKSSQLIFIFCNDRQTLSKFYFVASYEASVITGLFTEKRDGKIIRNKDSNCGGRSERRLICKQRPCFFLPRRFPGSTHSSFC